MKDIFFRMNPWSNINVILNDVRQTKKRYAVSE